MDDSREIRIENKLDRVAEDISRIKVVQGKQHISLEHHIKRTDLLELHVERVWTAYKALGIIVTILAAAASIAEIVGYFHGK